MPGSAPRSPNSLATPRPKRPTCATDLRDRAHAEADQIRTDADAARDQAAATVEQALAELHRTHTALTRHHSVLSASLAQLKDHTSYRRKDR